MLIHLPSGAMVEIKLPTQSPAKEVQTKVPEFVRMAVLRRKKSDHIAETNANLCKGAADDNSVARTDRQTRAYIWARAAFEYANCRNGHAETIAPSREAMLRRVIAKGFKLRWQTSSTP